MSKLNMAQRCVSYYGWLDARDWLYYGFGHGWRARAIHRRRQFLGVVSPFNPPFGQNEIVSVGEGGHIMLRLSHYAIPQAAGPEIGVFENVGLIDINYPNGQAGSPAGTFGP